MTHHILIVDDEKEMRYLIRTCLNLSAFQLIEAASGQEAIEKIKEKRYDLILLDIMMPVMDGFDVLHDIRNKMKMDIPVVLITALGDTENVVKGLNAGADDYIVKPFEPREMKARIESVLRRSEKREAIDQKLIQRHGLVFEPDKYRVSYQGDILPLTKKEFLVFKRLASHSGQVYTREQLLEMEWGHDFEGDSRTVDAHIKNIREKLKQVSFTEPIIETVWGIGYQLREE